MDKLPKEILSIIGEYTNIKKINKKLLNKKRINKFNKIYFD